MKKIPTLFQRIYENHKIVGITDEITTGCADAFYHGIATVKMDGSCCAIINGEFYKRYDAKKGKKPPEGALPCCEPDPTTGHWPHWVKVDPDNSADKWFVEAFRNSTQYFANPEGTYEAVGPHFQKNPYCYTVDHLVKHGEQFIPDLERDFESVKEFLTKHDEMEGIVFWIYGEPVCKIKRSDFGLPWPVK